MEADFQGDDLEPAAAVVGVSSVGPAVRSGACFSVVLCFFLWFYAVFVLRMIDLQGTWPKPWARAPPELPLAAGGGARP